MPNLDNQVKDLLDKELAIKKIKIINKRIIRVNQVIDSKYENGKNVFSYNEQLAYIAQVTSAVSCALDILLIHSPANSIKIIEYSTDLLSLSTTIIESKIIVEKGQMEFNINFNKLDELKKAFEKMTKALTKNISKEMKANNTKANKATEVSNV